jgi:hypothetical protein
MTTPPRRGRHTTKPARRRPLCRSSRPRLLLARRRSLFRLRFGPTPRCSPVGPYVPLQSSSPRMPSLPLILSLPLPIVLPLPLPSRSRPCPVYAYLAHRTRICFPVLARRLFDAHCYIHIVFFFSFSFLFGRLVQSYAVCARLRGCFILSRTTGASCVV